MNKDEETRIDWFRVIENLKRLGISLYGIELETGIKRTTLWGYKSGTRPRHDDGELLLGLWMRMTGKTREDAPREKRHKSVARAR